MGWFSDNPVVRHYAGQNTGELVEELRYTDNDGLVHTAPVGLQTDGATVWKLPRATWWISGAPYGRYLAAYLIHDAECVAARNLTGKYRKEARLDADRTLREMVRSLGASRVTASLIYRGVRVGAAFGAGGGESVQRNS